MAKRMPAPPEEEEEGEEEEEEEERRFRMVKMEMFEECYGPLM